jgi:hypothetical protein
MNLTWYSLRLHFSAIGITDYTFQSHRSHSDPQSHHGSSFSFGPSNWHVMRKCEVLVRYYRRSVFRSTNLWFCYSCVKWLAVSWRDVTISFCLLRVVIIYHFFTVLVTLAMNGRSLCILSELCSWYRQTLSLASLEPTFGNNRNLILKWVNDRWKWIGAVLMELRY